MVSSSRDNIYRLPNFGIEGAVPEYLRRPKPPVLPWWLEPLPPPLPCSQREVDAIASKYPFLHVVYDP